MLEKIVPTSKYTIRASADTMSLGDHTTQTVDIAISMVIGNSGRIASKKGLMRPVRSR